MVIKIFNQFIYWYYRVLGLVVDRVIVLSPVLYKRAVRLISREKVEYRFHPVWQQTRKKVSREAMRKQLNIKKNERVLLYFGFTTWYKGADWLVKTFDKLSRKKEFTNYKLVLAGGSSFTLSEKKYYQEYYQKIIEIAAKNRKITVTGFVPDNEVGGYFQAADLVLFPYRSIIGASGCLAQAIAYKKAFLISKALLPSLKNELREEVLAETGLAGKDISFYLNSRLFGEKLTSLTSGEIQSLQKLSEKVSKSLSLSRWIKVYELGNSSVEGKQKLFSNVRQLLPNFAYEV